MNRVLKEIYAERRNRKLKIVAFGLAIIGIYAIWSIATYDFCLVLFNKMFLKCNLKIKN